MKRWKTALASVLALILTAACRMAPAGAESLVQTMTDGSMAHSYATDLVYVEGEDLLLGECDGFSVYLKGEQAENLCAYNLDSCYMPWYTIMFKNDTSMDVIATCAIYADGHSSDDSTVGTTLPAGMSKDYQFGAGLRDWMAHNGGDEDFMITTLCNTARLDLLVFFCEPGDQNIETPLACIHASVILDADAINSSDADDGKQSEAAGPNAGSRKRKHTYRNPEEYTIVLKLLDEGYGVFLYQMDDSHAFMVYGEWSYDLDTGYFTYESLDLEIKRASVYYHLPFIWPWVDGVRTMEEIETLFDPDTCVWMYKLDGSGILGEGAAPFSGGRELSPEPEAEEDP